MKSSAKVIFVLLLLCLIHSSVAKPKWIWMDDDFVDDVEVTKNGAEGNTFENGKRLFTKTTPCRKYHRWSC